MLPVARTPAARAMSGLASALTPVARALGFGGSSRAAPTLVSPTVRTWTAMQSQGSSGGGGVGENGHDAASPTGGASGDVSGALRSSSGGGGGAPQPYGPPAQHTAPPARPAATAPAAQLVSAVTGTRALVVDDSEANRRFAAFVLRKLGCGVAAVGDGDAVLPEVERSAASGEPYGVVLMDLVMVCARARRECYCAHALRVSALVVAAHGRHVATSCALARLQVRMNGDAALRALRGAGHGMPVLAVTANATPEDNERYISQGFAGVLGKPFSAEQMHAVLDRALRADTLVEF